MQTFLIAVGSLLISLAVSAACAVAGVLLLAVLWEAFGMCAAFGGSMEGACGYAFMFFFMPIIVLACLLFVTILAYRRIHPWLARRLGG